MTMHQANPGYFPRSRPALPRNFLVVGRGQAYPPQASHTDAKLHQCALAYDTGKAPAAESKVGDETREGVLKQRYWRGLNHNHGRLPQTDEIIF